MEGFAEALESGDINLKEDVKELGKKLVTKFNWEIGDVKKIWAFGPESVGSNVVVDCTKGVQYMNEIRENVVAAFNWVTRLGVLAEEQMRNVRFDVNDAVLHADVIHRGGGQIIPAGRRSLFASQLKASPRLMEPFYLVDIQCPDDAINGVYNVLNQRRGIVIEQTQQLGNPLFSVKAHLPVLESFGFTSTLSEETSGKAFPQLIFDHWEIIEEDPLVKGGKANDLLANIRKRKGLDIEVPPLERFLDKL